MTAPPRESSFEYEEKERPTTTGTTSTSNTSFQRKRRAFAEAKEFCEEMGCLPEEQAAAVASSAEGSDSESDDESGPEHVAEAWANEADQDDDMPAAAYASVAAADGRSSVSTTSVNTSVSSSAPRITAGDIERLQDTSVMEMLLRNRELHKYFKAGDSPHLSTTFSDTGSVSSTSSSMQTPIAQLKQKTFMTGVSVSTPQLPPNSNNNNNVNDMRLSLHSVSSMSSLKSTQSSCTVVMTPKSGMSAAELEERQQAQTAFMKAMQARYRGTDSPDEDGDEVDTITSEATSSLVTPSSLSSAAARSNNKKSTATTTTRRPVPPPKQQRLQKRTTTRKVPLRSSHTNPQATTVNPMRGSKTSTPLNKSAFGATPATTDRDDQSDSQSTISVTTTSTNNTCFIARNKQLAHKARYYSLTEEEEARVEELMKDETYDAEEEDVQAPEGEGYKLTAAEKLNIDDIHEKLKQLRDRGEAEWERLLEPAPEEKKKTFRKNVWASSDDKSSPVENSKTTKETKKNATSQSQQQAHNSVVNFLSNSRMERAQRTRLTDIHTKLDACYQQERSQLQLAQTVSRCERSTLDKLLAESRKEQGIDETSDYDGSDVEKERDPSMMVLPSNNEDASYKFIWDTVESLDPSITRCSVTTMELCEMQNRDMEVIEDIIEKAGRIARQEQLKKQQEEEDGAVTMERCFEVEAAWDDDVLVSDMDNEYTDTQDEGNAQSATAELSTTQMAPASSTTDVPVPVLAPPAWSLQ
eukprot:TRINITY_DN94602_c0_g1_i1.p1 TRINITY_DN94602_c0_g1~~TRINITY_DN94602_c0_g1_i1.p1  ORF type:complete len:787 (-),score=112.08 TRINITY_DN94602_c0_g1_i1:134-2392(-)